MLTVIIYISLQVTHHNKMREWLSGGAPPCQGGGRGFDSRLALFLLGAVKLYSIRLCGTFAFRKNGQFWLRFG